MTGAGSLRLRRCTTEISRMSSSSKSVSDSLLAVFAPDGTENNAAEDDDDDDDEDDENKEGALGAGW